MISEPVISHQSAERVLRRAGYSPERIAEILAHLPDPIDVIRDGQTLTQYGLTRSHMMDLMGGGP